jgi:TRAF3-interacting protein 1
MTKSKSSQRIYVNFNYNKGEEPEKTNIFLQAFYKAATSGKDFSKYIKKYLDHRKKKEEERKNKEKGEEVKKEALKEQPKEALKEQPKPEKKESSKEKEEPKEIKEQKTQNEERKTVKKKKNEEPKEVEQPITKPNVVVERPQRVASALKRPEKVKENVEEINDNQNQGGSRPLGIISDKNKDDDEDGDGEKKNQEEKEEENVQTVSKGIKFDTKLRPGAKDANTGKPKPAVNVTDLESIKNYVQEISRNANPIGKIIDFLPDDIDSMNKELASWIKEQKILKEKYDEEVK